jgi:hypothetical protein
MIILTGDFPPKIIQPLNKSLDEKQNNIAIKHITLPKVPSNFIAIFHIVVGYCKTLATIIQHPRQQYNTSLQV